MCFVWVFSVLCLLGSKQYSASIAFTLALFSHLVNHVNIRLQAELEEAEGQVPPLNTDITDDLEVRDMSAPPKDCCDEKPLQNGSVEQEDEEKDEDGGERVHSKKQGSVEEQCKLEEEKQRQKKKYTRLSRLRRRRCGRKDAQGEDESDLSEGFESEEDEDDDDERRGHADSAGGTATGTPPNPPSVRKETRKDPLGEEGSWGSGSEEEEEEGGTAFDVETDSDMNSQESRSDLEDIEDTENSDNLEGRARDHQEEDEDQPKEEGGDRDGDTPPTTNGPLMPSDASISSNLQAMSSQLFQAKRCFRLAPTFSNMLLRPQASSSSGIPTPTDTSAPPSQETPPPPGDSPCDMNPGTANGTNDNGNVFFASVKHFCVLFVFFSLLWMFS